MSADDNKPGSAQLTPSICEDVLEEFRNADDTLANLIESNHIEVRDFIILSFVCDQGEMTIDRIVSALGLSRETAMSCVERLGDMDFVTFEIDEPTQKIKGSVSATAFGRAITQRIHSGNASIV